MGRVRQGEGAIRSELDEVGELCEPFDRNCTIQSSYDSHSNGIRRVRRVQGAIRKGFGLVRRVGIAIRSELDELRKAFERNWTN